MRGDSLRDLYAKVLALFGLGLLAGAGALVEYWPVAEELPRVSSDRSEVAGHRLPSLPDAAVFQTTTARVALSRRTTPTRRPAIAPAAETETAPAPEIPAETLANFAVPANIPVTTIAADLPFSVAVDLSAPAPPALDLVPAGEAAFASAALQLASRPERVALAEPPEVTNHQPSDGPITGALRRTGELAGASIGKAGGAIMRTGAVAGASIVDAFRGLAGAVKKVSPFVP